MSATPSDRTRQRRKRHRLERAHERRSLALARVVWLLFAAFTLVPFILALPATWHGLEAMASGSNSGIPEAVYAWVALGLICLAMLVAVVIALILFLRRSDN